MDSVRKARCSARTACFAWQSSASTLSVQRSPLFFPQAWSKEAGRLAIALSMSNEALLIGLAI